MSSFAFAWRSLFRQPARAVLAIAGIATVGALLFDMLLLSRGLLISFRDLLGEVGFDVRVTATSSLPMTGPRIVDAISTAAALAHCRKSMRSCRCGSTAPAWFASDNEASASRSSEP